LPLHVRFQMPEALEWRSFLVVFACLFRTVVSLNCSISLQRIPIRSPVKRDTLKKNTKFRAGYCFQTKPFHKWVWIKIR
jgi:hypothetical protein